MKDNDISPFWWVIGFIILLIWLSGGFASDDSGYYDGCYDADPTQWTDIVCE